VPNLSQGGKITVDLVENTHTRDPASIIKDSNPTIVALRLLVINHAQRLTLVYESKNTSKKNNNVIRFAKKSMRS
jgi:hypothetical protein